MQQYYKVTLFLLAVWMLSACTAPNDIDTPRKVHRTDEAVSRIAVQSIDVKFRPLSATLPLPYTCVWQRAEIDTANNGTLWLHGVCTAPSNSSPSDDFLLRVLTVHFEGLELSSPSIPVRGDVGVAEGTTLTIGSLLNDSSETEIIPDNNINTLELQNVVHNRQTRHVSADIWILLPVDGRAVGIEGTLDIWY